MINKGTPGWKEFVDKYFHKPNQYERKNSEWETYDALLTPLLDPSGNIIGILTLILRMMVFPRISRPLS